MDALLQATPTYPNPNNNNNNKKGSWVSDELQKSEDA